MFRPVLAFCAAILSAFGISAAQAIDSSEGKGGLTVKPGDVIVTQDKGHWSAIKILAVDQWPDGGSAAHCLTYEAVPSKPSLESLRKTAVLAWHAPIDAASFRTDWELIGNEVATKGELVGFVEYLKLTDFPRYVAFTGQDSKEIVRKANGHFKRAYALGEQGDRKNAIAEYTEAIELFPLFYEAIDNRAFTYMELGMLREALLDFEQSLRVNPNGVSAFFSRGECLMKLGEFTAAELVFQAGQNQFPEHRIMFTKFLGQVRALRRGG